MVEDLHMRTEEGSLDKTGEKATGMARFKQMQVLDLEKNILQVLLLFNPPYLQYIGMY